MSVNHLDTIGFHSQSLLAMKNPIKQLTHFVLFEFQTLISIDMLSSFLSWEERYATCDSIAVSIYIQCTPTYQGLDVEKRSMSSL